MCHGYDDARERASVSSLGSIYRLTIFAIEDVIITPPCSAPLVLEPILRTAVLLIIHHAALFILILNPSPSFPPPSSSLPHPSTPFTPPTSWNFKTSPKCLASTACTLHPALAPCTLHNCCTSKERIIIPTTHLPASSSMSFNSPTRNSTPRPQDSPNRTIQQSNDPTSNNLSHLASPLCHPHFPTQLGFIQRLPTPSCVLHHTLAPFLPVSRDQKDPSLYACSPLPTICRLKYLRIIRLLFHTAPQSLT